MNFKKITAIVLTATAAFGVFTACNNTNEPGSDDVVVISSGSNATQDTYSTHIADANDAGYYCEYNGTKVRVNTDANAILAALGSDYQYFEAPSCAGLGMSKTYTYNNGAFVISTVPVGNIDLISNVVLLNDSVSTPEGIYIGSTKDDVIKAYGNPTTDVIDGTYCYELNDTMLVIITQDDVVTSISFNQVI